VRALRDVRAGDVGLVGGKNASLGEMIARLAGLGVRVPEGFATTVHAYRAYVEANGIARPLSELMSALAEGRIPLATAGHGARNLFLKGQFPDPVAASIRWAYGVMARGNDARPPPVAVRSSATAEDLPDASFAGQQETYLNVRGEEALLDACRRCFASLFTDRAITYRQLHGYDSMRVALSVGVQHMVHSDEAGSGVMFSIDTESGFPRVVLINAAWGLGETVVQGAVDPDEYMVFKPLLAQPGCRPIIEKRLGAKEQKLIGGNDARHTTRLVSTIRSERERYVLDDDEILELARAAVTIESHYGRAVDVEWAKDGPSGGLFIVQARPETVQSRAPHSGLRTYAVTAPGELLVTGLAIGNAAAAGRVCRLMGIGEMDRFESGAVLVTGKTDPDWVPLMKRAAAIVTDHGGRTSHAAIVSRELGLPAVVGTGNGTLVLRDGMDVTVSCAEGQDGHVYRGIGAISVQKVRLDTLPRTRTQVMLNLAEPAAALRWWALPCDGVGLARMEFIISNQIRIHPMALVREDRVADPEARRLMQELTRGWDSRPAYFVDTLANGIALIAASQYPHPVIVRMSDFKTNEYAELIGGAAFEPREPNPMLGWRGASRYYHPDYRDGFALECRAIRKVREHIGLGNVVVMIPFCRTPDEADRVLAVMAEHGLERGRNGLEVYVMGEIPSNVLLADDFARRFDGFSIGSNDLTQLVLGVDRDSERLAPLFDEDSPAVKMMIADLIAKAHAHGCKVGLCGQAPSDRPEFARFLVESGIDSMSVNPDSFARVKAIVADAEATGAGAAHARRRGHDPGARSTGGPAGRAPPAE
jgi:pyruvate,water dikinase